MPRTPAAGGRPSSVTVRAAPHRATFPKGKAMCSAQSTGEPRSGTNYFCARLHFFLPRRFCVSLPQSFVAAKRQQNPALPPRRYPLTLRLRYLAFADGGSRNSSLHPPQEALGISTLAQGSRERAQYASVHPIYKNVTARRSHLIFAAYGGKT